MFRKKIHKELSISIWLVCGLTAFAGLGWMIASFLYGKTMPNQINEVISGIGIQLSKTVFIGSSIAIAINLYLKNILGDTTETYLKKIGIQEIYSLRVEALSDLIKTVKNNKNKEIYLVGISLRDFFTGNGCLREVWHHICERLEHEQKFNLGKQERLHIKVLLINPVSSEGVFRHDVEKEFMGEAGLVHDVPTALAEIKQIICRIYKSKDQKFLQVRLYEHCPFSFMFVTNKEIFIEQYSYRDHRKRISNIPLIKYSNENSPYSTFLYSLKNIWKYAIDKDNISFHDVGVAKAIDGAKIRNIFRNNDKLALTNRQIECIGRTEPGNEIKILAVTGKHYISDDMDTKKALYKKALVEGVKIKFLLVNPVSEQAIFRAVSDSSSDQIGDSLTKWSWEKHQDSKLYQNLKKSIAEIQSWQHSNKNKTVESRLYSSSIACALLLTQESGFIEQYIYGRSVNYEGIALGGEYPIIEYDFSKYKNIPSEAEKNQINYEKELLTSHFDIIWDNFSIDIQEYFGSKEEEKFKENLNKIISKCNFSITSDNLLPTFAE